MWFGFDFLPREAKKEHRQKKKKEYLAKIKIILDDSERKSLSSKKRKSRKDLKREFDEDMEVRWGPHKAWWGPRMERSMEASIEKEMEDFMDDLMEFRRLLYSLLLFSRVRGIMEWEFVYWGF